MKILEGQSNLLSNHEVYEHILEQQKKNRSKDRRVPPNQFTLTKDLLTCLRTKPGPLANQDKTHQYSTEALYELFKKLREANLQSDLSKGEMLMIVNLRPTNIAVLSTVVEDMLERFTEDEQQKIIDIITETLGFDEPAEAAEGEEYDEDAEPSIENS
ncbi:RNA polymerase Rpb4-domain-containing protein [Pseudoneurospora amorphoporcata]|uniref:DNA-directed RNA polymerase III subunit RPC9 n=1 Tax=Pseudoneurospora amorphoporcata TaxID=241081 RepID=A0AAN6NLI0_9PEZI|nr:RNA polymerase Rpb4-domain-containing protein [Pseudoneurospora amorphoporcata]